MEAQKKNIAVSVIVPTYNTSMYLERCMDSLIAQTIDDMEIIVIDDCSDEDIQSVVVPYIGQSDKVVCFERLAQHQGPGGARNRGIELALIFSCTNRSIRYVFPEPDTPVRKFIDGLILLKATS